MTPKGEQRTIYEAGLEIDYSIRLHELQSRLLRRSRFLIAFVQLGIGSAVIAPLVGGLPLVAGVAGVALGLITIADALLDMQTRAAASEFQRKRLKQLRGAMDGRSLAEIDRDIQTIEADDPAEIESLRVVAYNDVVRRWSHFNRMQPESWAQRLLRCLA